MGYDIEKREKREAIEAGRRAFLKTVFSTAKRKFKQCKELGPGRYVWRWIFFTTMLKHSKMDQAKRNMEQAKV